MGPTHGQVLQVEGVRLLPSPTLLKLLMAGMVRLSPLLTLELIPAKYVEETLHHFGPSWFVIELMCVLVLCPICLWQIGNALNYLQWMHRLKV
jgi:hypothetical protein